MQRPQARILASSARALFVAAVTAAAAAATEGGRPGVRPSTPEAARTAVAAPRGPLGPPRILPVRHAARASSPAALTASTLEEAIDAVVLADMAATDSPGAQIAVVIDGVLVYQRGYGLRHRENGGEVDDQTLFRIGSLTKQFTAAAVLQQVEAGALSLDDPITRFVPELSLSGLWPASSITVRHLLTHASGFPDNWDEIDASSEDGALALWAGQQGSVALHAPPGSFWNYTNPGYILAGLALERASGTPFRTYVESRVFAPAGLTSATFSTSAAQATHNFAYGHFRSGGGGRETFFSPNSYDSAAAAPAGYAFSTAADLARWAMLLMDGGGAVLSPASADALQGRQVYMDYVPGLYYGYGVIRQDYKGVDIVWHDGSIPGWGSVLLWAPQDRVAVAVLANTSEPLYEAAFGIADLVLQPAAVEPPDLGTDPATWLRYTGTYTLTDYAGGRMETRVSLGGDRLDVTFSPLDGPAAPYTTQLVQAYLDTFVLDSNGDGILDMEFTFIRSGAVTSKTRWMRYRYAVGERCNRPRRALP